MNFEEHTGKACWRRRVSRYPKEAAQSTRIDASVLFIPPLAAKAAVGHGHGDQLSNIRSQVDPQVVVYATHDEEVSTVVLLVIEKVGKGMAKDVTFSLSRPIPKRAFGIGDDAADPEEMDYPDISEFGTNLAQRPIWGMIREVTAQCVRHCLTAFATRFLSNSIRSCFYPAVNHVINRVSDKKDAIYYAEVC